MDVPVITLKAVGDICPGDATIPGLGICSLTMKWGVDFPFKYIASELSEADIVIGNLEGVLSRRVKEDLLPELLFCGLPEFADGLKKTGFTVISVANNHVLDNGIEIFLETVELLQSQGINVCGLRGKEEFYSEPVIFGVREKKIGILGYNWISTDKYPFVDQYIAQSKDSVVNYTWERNNLKDKENQDACLDKNVNVINDIKLLKRKVDIVILLSHWAFEFVHHPPYGVTLEARSFIDAGADLIIGTHPHVIQGYEKYHDKHIFYSLGNFIFDSRKKITGNGMILRAVITPSDEMNCSLKLIKRNKQFQPTNPSATSEEEMNRIIQQSNLMISSSEKKELLNDDNCYREFEKQYNFGKYQMVIDHLRALFIHPAVIKVIFKKILGFVHVIKLRLQGEKVRW